MIDHPSVNLIREEFAWPDAVRVPLADETARRQFSDAARIIAGQIEATTWSKLERGQLILTQRLLADWARGRVPQQPAPETITIMQEVLGKFKLGDAEATLKKRWPEKIEGLFPPNLWTGPQIIVRIPPPPTLSGLTTFFPPSAAQLTLAQRTLIDYQKWNLSGWQVPLRSRQFKMTGLLGYLNGQLKTPPTELEPGLWHQAAQTWLFQPPDPDGATVSPAACLFGLNLAPEAFQQQFELLDAVMVPQSRAKTIADGAASELTTAVHVRFQQKYERWPVYGGRVVVHMGQGDPRCSVSSSYLPIPADHFPGAQPRSEADARQIALLALAQHALNGKMEKREAIGFYLTALDLWLAVGSAGLAGHDWEQTIQDVAANLSEQVAASDSYVSVRQEVAATVDLAMQGPQQHLERLQAAVQQVRGRLRAQSVVEWDQGEVIRYATGTDSDKRFVLPFVGAYYLAYRVEFLSKARDRGWRVFVNADAADESCHVLGWPESLMAHTFGVYQTSEAAANDTLTSVSAPAVADLNFLSLKWHADQGGGPLTINEIATNPNGRPKELIQNAANVAYNAEGFYRYLTSLCTNADLAQMLEDKNRHAPYFDVKVGATGLLNDNLTTGFVASAVAPTVIFQSAPQLIVGNRVVRHPARDPEVVFHEIAHALMWLMNSEPFDMPVNATPFGRALIEGYANYFARACAVSCCADASDVPWARACYAAFDDRYNLSCDSVHSPAGNTLVYPNLYPPTPVADPHADDALTIELLQKYDVGMIWARVLWRIREQMIAARQAEGDGAELADKWALNSYFAIPGFIASLEMAAEGILDQASAAMMSQLVGLFGARNILAGRGVQALAQAGGEIWVGTDRGVRRSADGGQTWTPAPPNWETFGPGNGVVALAVDSVAGKLYAATERNIRQRDAGANVWREVGAWPSQQTPLCLSAVGGILYVGTATGVFFYDTAAGLGGSWTPWQATIPFQDLVLDLAAIRQGNFHMVYAANLRAAQSRLGRIASPNPTDLTWEPVADAAFRGQMGPTTAVTLDASDPVQSHAYIGTLAAGIWRQTDIFDPTTWQQIITAAQVQGCVLALRARPRAGSDIELFVAATSGLFKATQMAGVWTWAAIPINGGAITDVVLEVLPVGNDVLVGTANQGLWLGRNIAAPVPTWIQFPDIGL